jgi:hypothetical protein
VAGAIGNVRTSAGTAFIVCPEHQAHALRILRSLYLRAGRMPPQPYIDDKRRLALTISSGSIADAFVRIFLNDGGKFARYSSDCMVVTAAPRLTTSLPATPDVTEIAKGGVTTADGGSQAGPTQTRKFWICGNKESLARAQAVIQDVYLSTTGRHLSPIELSGRTVFIVTGGEKSSVAEVQSKILHALRRRGFRISTERTTGSCVLLEVVTSAATPTSEGAPTSVVEGAGGREKAPANARVATTSSVGSAGGAGLFSPIYQILLAAPLPSDDGPTETEMVDCETKLRKAWDANASLEDRLKVLEDLLANLRNRLEGKMRGREPGWFDSAETSLTRARRSQARGDQHSAYIHMSEAFRALVKLCFVDRYSRSGSPGQPHGLRSVVGKYGDVYYAPTGNTLDPEATRPPPPSAFTGFDECARISASLDSGGPAQTKEALEHQMERAIQWAIERNIFTEAEVRDEKGKRKIGKFQIRQRIWDWCYEKSLIRTWLRATLLPPGVTFMPGSKWARPVYPPATVRVDGGIDWEALLFDAVFLVAAILLTPGEPVDDAIALAALREELAGAGTRAAATAAEEAAASRSAIVRTVEELESGLDDAVRTGARGVAEEEGAAAGRGIRTKAPEGTRGVKAGEAPEGTGTGTGGTGTRSGGPARTPIANATGVKSEISQLPKGKNYPVVKSEAELKNLFGRLTETGRPAPHPRYAGPRMELPDGTTIGMRSSAKSTPGRPAIDIKYPDGTRTKVHIQQ